MRVPKMLIRLAIFRTAVLPGWMCSYISCAQTAAPGQAAGRATGAPASDTNPDNDKWKAEKWNTPSPPESYWEKVKSGPAPKRDISGIWDGGGVPQGVQPNGAYEYPDDPEHVGHDVPYSALGKEARTKNKPGTGMS